MTVSMRTSANRERGQAVIFISLSLLVVLGMMGLVVDFGWAYYRRQACKAAAQAAAMAGIKVAQNSPNFVCGGGGITCQSTPAPCPATLSTPTNAIQAACLYAKENGFVDDPANQKQRVLIAAYNGTPPVPGINPTYWMSATVSEKVPLWFSLALGPRNLNVTARATAAYFLPNVGGCIYTLEPTMVAVTNVGNPVLSSGCGMYVNSNNPEAVDLVGNARIEATGGSDVHIVGGWDQAGGATISPAPVLGVPPAPDPFGAMAPPADPGSCLYSAVVLSNHEELTLNPGKICGGISISGQSRLTMNPGVYYIENGISVTGLASITGYGVSLYVRTGSVSMTGGTALHMTAPTSGDWQGILLFQDRSNTNPATWVGGADAELEGVFYVPSANLSFAGGAASNKFAATIVCDTLTMVGNGFIRDPVSTKYTAGNAGVYLIE